MSYLKINIILTSLFLLMFGASKTFQTQSLAVHSNEPAIQVSPLSDDETDPIKNNTFEYTEFIITRDENYSFFSNLKIISFLGIFLSFISLALANSSLYLFLLKRFSAFSFLNSTQSYLQVFRI